MLGVAKVKHTASGWRSEASNPGPSDSKSHAFTTDASLQVMEQYGTHKPPEACFSMSCSSFWFSLWGKAMRLKGMTWFLELNEAELESQSSSGVLNGQVI